MTDTSRQATGQQDIMRFIRAHMRDYALLISLLAIMIFFQFATDGTLFKPVNMTNLILQNSYIAFNGALQEVETNAAGANAFLRVTIGNANGETLTSFFLKP